MRWGRPARVTRRCPCSSLAPTGWPSNRIAMSARGSPSGPSTYRSAPPEADLLEVVRAIGTELPTQRTEIPEGFPEPLSNEQSGTPLDPRAAGNLEVLTVARETGAPLPGVRVYANTDDGAPVEWVEKDGRDGTPITDQAGRARFLVPPGSTIRLWSSTQLPIFATRPRV